MADVLGPATLQEPLRSLRLRALVWPSLSDHVGNKRVDGSPLSLCLCLPLFYSVANLRKKNATLKITLLNSFLVKQSNI